MTDDIPKDVWDLLFSEFDWLQQFLCEKFDLPVDKVKQAIRQGVDRWI